jgi:hypothetical protein
VVNAIAGRSVSDSAIIFGDIEGKKNLCLTENQ